MWVLFWRCFLCKIMLMKFGFKCSEKLPRMRIKHNSALFVRAFNANVDLHSNSEMLHIPINWYMFSVSYFFEWKKNRYWKRCQKTGWWQFFFPEPIFIINELLINFHLLNLQLFSFITKKMQAWNYRSALWNWRKMFFFLLYELTSVTVANITRVISMR